VVIELSDSSDGEGDENEANRPVLTARARKVTESLAKEDELEDDPDEPFPELAAQARERARQRERDAQKAKLSTGDGSVPASSAVPVHDPILSVFIQSNIPDTNPLLVQRKYSQNIKAIRLAWCQKQGFDEKLTANVFFTYRGLRVFDVASCKSLGVQLDHRGNPVFGFSKNPELADKLVLTATTQEIIDAEKKAAEEQKQKQEEEAEGIYTAPEEPKVKEIKIFLKAKGFDNFRLKVRDVSFLFNQVLNARETKSLSRKQRLRRLLEPFASSTKSLTTKKSHCTLMETYSILMIKWATPILKTWIVLRFTSNDQATRDRSRLQGIDLI
jgi:hypothetical protein